MWEAIKQGKELPFDPQGQVIFYVGPTPAPPGRVIGSAGPTTAGRMDAYAPKKNKRQLSSAGAELCLANVDSFVAETLSRTLLSLDR